jgi:23S rRNA pseudouridine2605 synthase
MVYYAVHKPKGYVSTNQDPAGRPRVIDLLPEVPERVYSVGRLDEDSTGLMILTNDGELANRLAHPRYGVEKTYRALVAGMPGPEIVAKLVEGIWLSDGKVRAKRARLVGSRGEAATLELVLAEGKKREIRRMLAKLGHKVMGLTRIAIGPVLLKGLPPGEHRPLSHFEIDLLRKVAAGLPVPPPRFHDRKGGRRAGAPGGKGPSQTLRAGSQQSERKSSKPKPADRESNRPGRRQSSRPGTLPQPPRGQQSKPAGAVPPPQAPPPRPGSPGPSLQPKPSREARSGRRVIGLDPKIAAEAGLAISGRTPRRRPPARRKPPRKTLGIKRSGEGGDER